MSPEFATTQWTLVWQAAEEGSQYGRPALAELIKRYWQPLYGFARRRGLSQQDAEDATQEFLGRVITGDLLENADPAKGKFRSYLLTAWKRFLVDEYRKSNAVRRGGQAALIPLDLAGGEKQWQAIQSREPDPERLFMRSWASSLLDEVKTRLRRDYASSERARLIDCLLPRLTTTLSATEYAELGAELNLSPSAVKVAMHRLRQRFGNTLREVVLETVDDPSEVDSEISELLTVLKTR